MRITFLGAAGTVTGSRFLVESDETRVLVSVHGLCHDYIHDHPAEAKRRGFLVSSADELDRGWT